MKIGIRKETKNIWEKRAPLTPQDVEFLAREFNLGFKIQPSENRIFTDKEYSASGELIGNDLSDTNIILAIKEIPVDEILPHKTYIFFSHTIKGQSHNMPLLKRMMALKTNLIDYERIVDDKNRRLIFFGPFAGIAGMIETFNALGKKLELLGYSTPFLKIKQAYEYSSIEEAYKEIKIVAEEFKNTGLPESISPLTVGIAGYGNVSRGAQEVLDLFPVLEITPNELISRKDEIKQIKDKIIKIVFKEEDTVADEYGNFNLFDFYHNPDKYESAFGKFIPELKVLVNCIYWSTNNPRLVSKKYIRNSKENSPLIIGDISCDIEGGIELTYKSTSPDNPVYTYIPEKDIYIDNIEKQGITIMAIDNLPCEFSKDASKEFSSVLKNFLPGIAFADFSKEYNELILPDEIKRALILHNGELTANYVHLKYYLDKHNL